MASTKHSLANGHEIGDRVVAITYELNYVDWLYERLSMKRCTSCKLLAIKAYSYQSRSADAILETVL